MIPELGVFALILALMASILLAVIPLVGLRLKRNTVIDSAPFYVCLQFACVMLAYVSLTYSFITDDFSVIYVVSNSSILLPWFYKICAVWGGHEGSMLLWVAILSFWM